MHVRDYYNTMLKFQVMAQVLDHDELMSLYNKS